MGTLLALTKRLHQLHADGSKTEIDGGERMFASVCMQAFNPPLLHALATAAWPGAPRQLGRLVVAALGDGIVALYDADALQPPLPPSPKRPPKVNACFVLHAQTLGPRLHA